jgi:hypothetical protein
MAGKAKRISLKGIKAVKQKLNSVGPCAPNKAEQLKWQAECDARDLARAAEIYADPDRARRARGAASRLVRDEEARLANLRAISKKGAR